jgi:tetratricopeptide (TPR) repeat protein
MVGRDTQLRDVTQALERVGGLWILVGPGGVGKTRFASALATAWVGGCWWVDLQAVRDESGLDRALAYAMGMDAESDALRVLAERGRALLILDNFEQLNAVCRKRVDVWTRGAPSLRIVVTSRQVLGLAAEQVVDIEPLSLASSRQLFLGAAPLAFDGGRASPELVQSILETLQGLPLALELAAARLDILSLSQLQQRLSDPLRVLRDPTRDGGRHMGLSSTVAWSWDLLTEPEQSVLAQVSVFRGGFTLEAAEKVVASEADVLDVLHGLRARRLLTFDGHRFGMLEVIRQFALAAMTNQEVCARFDGYFAGLAGEAMAQMGTPGAGAALDLLASEYDSLHAVLQDGGRSEAVVVGEAMGVVLEHRGPAGAQLPIINRALDRCQAAPETRARLLRQRASFHEKRGSITQARQDLQEALQCAQSSPLLAAQVRIRIADLSVYEGHVGAAEVSYQEALKDARGHPDLEASIVVQLAGIALDDGRDEEAKSLEEEALRLARLGGNPYRIAKVLGTLASLSTERHDLERSREYGTEALALFKELGIPRSVAFTTGNLGLVEEVSGALDEAEALYRQAVHGAIQAEDRRLTGIWTGFLGRVFVSKGRSEEGCRHLMEAISILETSGAARFVSIFRGCIALDAATRGDLEAVQQQVERIETEASAGWPMATLAVEVVRCHIANKAGEDAARQAHLAEAERLFEANNDEKVVAGVRQMFAVMTWIRADLGAWVVSRNGAWFRAPGQADVAVQGAQARVLACLVDRHRGQPVQVEDLVRAGWPDERISPSSATNRVYVALTSLRKAGLRRLIVGARPGWCLDSAQEVRVVG